MKVICISGKAQNGKDTSAEFMKAILEAKGQKVLIAHYGDLVKYVTQSFFDWNGEKDERGRSLLQKVGTDIVRKKDPNYWVRFVADMLSFFYGSWDYVLIPDCRFPGEIDYLKEHGFHTIHMRVVRQNFQSPLTEEQQNHPSETALDHTLPDHYINNYGSLEDLRNTLAGIVKEIAL